MSKPKLSLWEIFKMSFGFFGIQVGFGLQGGNMSRIFENLGAPEGDLPFMFLAAPLTGLIVQPIIGYVSDNTWGRYGRRKPFFFVGALLSAIALLFMPNSPTMWWAFGMLWILDASINISMEPFRALVADKLPISQRTQGYAMQSILIGFGAVLASFMPWLFTWLGVSNDAVVGSQSDAVKLAFYIGAAFFFGAVLFTVLTTKEYSPEEVRDFESDEAESTQKSGAASVATGYFGIPKTMYQLAVVQFFTWFALFALFVFATPAVARHIYGAEPETDLYEKAGNWVGIGYVLFNGMAGIFGFILPMVARLITRRYTHLICLVIGAIGFVSFFFVPEVAPGQESKEMLISFSLLGIAWSSILSMPYAMLSSGVPSKNMGFYMGLFNMFICLPQILASLGVLKWLTVFPQEFVTGENVEFSSIHAMLVGGVLMLFAAASVLLVRDREQDEDKVGDSGMGSSDLLDQPS